MDYEPNQAFRFSSPFLGEIKEDIMKECPIGYILRTTPHIFSVISLSGHLENGSINLFDLSGWAREAVSVVFSEKGRMMEIERDQMEMNKDKVVGRRSLKAAP